MISRPSRDRGGAKRWGREDSPGRLGHADDPADRTATLPTGPAANRDRTCPA